MEMAYFYQGGVTYHELKKEPLSEIIRLREKMDEIAKAIKDG